MLVSVKMSGVVMVFERWDFWIVVVSRLPKGSARQRKRERFLLHCRLNFDSRGVTGKKMWLGDGVMAGWRAPGETN